MAKKSQKTSKKSPLFTPRNTKKLLVVLFAGLLLLVALFFSYQKIVKPNLLVTSPRDSTGSVEEAKSDVATHKNEVGKTKNVVASGDVITVDYIGKYAKDGKIFDTSIASVAKQAGVYQEGRNYEEGLTFVAGAGQMIKGFDAGVIGMKKGETRVITVQAKDGYGERDPNAIQPVPLTQLPPKPTNEPYATGDVLQSIMGPVKIVGISGDSAIIDFNHFLAGEDLIFEVTVREIK